MRVSPATLVVLLFLATPFGCVAEAQDLWSGFYAGGAIGRRDVDSNWETTCLQPGFAFGSCPHSGFIFADRFATDNPALFDVERFRLSGYAGVQWQLGRLVVGIEGDRGKADSRVSRAGIPGAEDPTDPDLGPDETVLAYDWDASLRGRLGFLAAPETLFYITAGRAWLKAEASVHCAVEFPDGWCGADNVGRTDLVERTLVGRTWGGGVETLIDRHWMLRLEYRRARYEDFEHTFFDGIVRNTDALATDITSATRTFSLGLAYKF